MPIGRGRLQHVGVVAGTLRRHDGWKYFRNLSSWVLDLETYTFPITSVLLTLGELSLRVLIPGVLNLSL